MNHKPALLLACAIAGLLSTVATPVGAFSCPSLGATAPLRDQKDVPTNTLIWCSIEFVRSTFPLRLLGPDQSEVTGTLSSIGSPMFTTMVFHPSQELAPNTRYQVDCTGGGATSDTLPAFTTGSGPRSGAPALPRLQGLQTSAESNGDNAPIYCATFENVSDVGTIVVLDLEGTATLDTTAISGTVSDSELMGGDEGIRPNLLQVGQGPCTENWPDAKLGASARLRLGAFDLTGAFSGWTNQLTVTLPDHLAEPEGPDPSEQQETTTTRPPDVLAPTGDEPRATGEGVPPQPEQATDLASDSSVSSPQEGGCQLGGGSGWWRSSAWSTLGLLGALAGMRARRQSRRAR